MKDKKKVKGTFMNKCLKILMKTSSKFRTFRSLKKFYKMRNLLQESKMQSGTQNREMPSKKSKIPMKLILNYSIK
jgi:hypothetical protein